MLHIDLIPILKDNYVFALVNQNKAWVVDPGDHQPVIQYLQQRNLDLQGILITHNHWDHVSGCASLIEATGKSVAIVGPKHPQTVCNTLVADGDRLNCLGVQVEVLGTPGHTLDHLAYWLPQQQSLLCGDTLFRFGCGRLFDGTAELLFHSLQRFKTLPKETQVYCTHEYTLSNIRFAQAVDPDNADLKKLQSACQQKVDLGEPTIPFTLQEQLSSNPFLRTDDNTVQHAIAKWAKHNLETEADYFRALRSWKDQF